MQQLQFKILEFLKGMGTILLYFIISLICSYFFQDFYYHDNFVIATIFQLLVYVIMLLILGIIYHKRLIKDFKNFKKDYISIAFKNWIIGLGVMFIANILISSFVSGIASNEEANRTLL